ncbi:TonB-dependent receptor [Rheinheimera soli]|uniref:Iron complex outermembrane receptor protein n=1 Tax=Rheinheimera soli TaxID=443616 RepID=A0ABU1W516_9GAMM|nr:TonB-dependent receptor [Rheinheimera soli]MDR7123067.1 iron complex outermembrane receptor protein [Rheinheimera soli]
MFTNNKLSKAVQLAIAFGAVSATAFTASVTAQEDATADKVERIEITGSRIKRTDLESASPITVFTSADIEASGHPTLEKFVQSLPAVNGAAQGSNVNNGSNGSATVSLRGLGAGRTLILVNGRRTAFGDLNSIPTSFVERVEVLRDGASTIYGSDAIAGVVNFITKTNFEGTEVSAQYDLTGEGDGETTKLAVTTGASSDKGNVVLSLEYTNRNSIWQGDRDFSKCPLTDNGQGGTECFGSGTGADGTFSSSAAGYPGSWIVDPVTGQNRRLTNADAFNYAAVSYMVTPQEIFSINGAGRYELSGNTSIFTEAGFTNRQSDQLMGAEGTFWGQVVPANHPDNPTRFAPDGTPQAPINVNVNRRLFETGGRAFTQDFSDYRMVVGLEGSLENDWSWDVSYNYARFVDARIDYGRANPKRFNTLTSPTACAADAACPGLWNPFKAGTLTPEMIAYAFLPNSPVVRGTTKQLQANLSGDFGDFGLPAGPMAWATGVEKRWEDYMNQPDGAAILGEIFGVVGEKTEGAYNLNEAYVEISAPLLADLPMVERLNLSAAIRRSDYDFLEATSNTKIGLEWTPFDGLLIRATKADGFRAPGITELFAPQAESNLSYNEPCTRYATGTQSATVKANCAAEGLPGDFALTSNQSSSLTGGNPDLEPEESESFTMGFVYTPFDNFSFALDYFDIEINNGIGTAGTNNIVNACYESPNFSSPLCALVAGPSVLPTPRAPHGSSPRRDVLGAISGVMVTNANLSTFNTSGVDFDTSYSFDVATGRVKLRVDGTYLDSYQYTPFAGEDSVEYAGKFAEDQWEVQLGAFAKWRTNFTASYATDAWQLSYTARYMSATEDLFADPDNLSNTANAIIYQDLQGSYFLDNYTFSLGVRNMFDKKPPYTTNNQDMNTINSSYDTAGQYWYARVNAKF